MPAEIRIDREAHIIHFSGTPRPTPTPTAVSCERGIRSDGLLRMVTYLLYEDGYIEGIKVMTIGYVGVFDELVSIDSAGVEVWRMTK